MTIRMDLIEYGGSSRRVRLDWLSSFRGVRLNFTNWASAGSTGSVEDAAQETTGVGRTAVL